MDATTTINGRIMFRTPEKTVYYDQYIKTRVRHRYTVPGLQFLQNLKDHRHNRVLLHKPQNLGFSVEIVEREVFEKHTYHHQKSSFGLLTGGRTVKWAMSPLVDKIINLKH